MYLHWLITWIYVDFAGHPWRNALKKKPFSALLGAKGPPQGAVEHHQAVQPLGALPQGPQHLA